MYSYHRYDAISTMQQGTSAMSEMRHYKYGVSNIC
jgi:hypothetical protein